VFPRTLRALAREPGRPALWLLSVGLLVAWGAWFFRARVAVYARSEQARLEIDRAVYAIDAPVDGRVVAAHVELHRPVRAGDVLVEIEHEREARQLAEALAQLRGFGPQIEAARAEIEAEQKALLAQQGEGASGVDEARARLTEAESITRRAREESARLERLHKEGLASEMEWVKARAELERAAASEQAARAAMTRAMRDGTVRSTERNTRIAGLRREIARIEADEAVARASVERLREELDRRILRAPQSGILGETSSVRVGALVKAGDRLASIVAGGTVRIVAQFSPASSFGRIRPGQRARMRLDGFPWTEFGALDATVVEVASEARDGLARVQLSVNEPAPARVPIEHGLPGIVDVTVEHATPLALVLRTVGRSLDGATPAGGGS
jgi:membrane fusion protein (multidrug efflux system)